MSQLPPELVYRVICEVLSESLHASFTEVNLGWHPRAEDVLWRPDLQETKTSENGQLNVRYNRANKARAIRTLTDLIARHTPWLPVRYAF